MLFNKMRTTTKLFTKRIIHFFLFSVKTSRQNEINMLLTAQIAPLLYMFEPKLKTKSRHLWISIYIPFYIWCNTVSNFGLHFCLPKNAQMEVLHIFICQIWIKTSSNLQKKKLYSIKYCSHLWYLHIRYSVSKPKKLMFGTWK